MPLLEPPGLFDQEALLALPLLLVDPLPVDVPRWATAAAGTRAEACSAGTGAITVTVPSQLAAHPARVPEPAG